MASSFFNLGSIVSGVALGYWLEPEFFRPVAEGVVAPTGEKALTGMAIGVVVGGICQLGFQLPALLKVGFHFRPDFVWKDPGVKRVLSLMGPAIVSGAAVQVGVVINTVFASFIQTEGAVSSLQWAFRLMQLPIGVFGVAIATVTLPAASRRGGGRDYGRVPRNPRPWIAPGHAGDDPVCDWPDHLGGTNHRDDLAARPFRRP